MAKLTQWSTWALVEKAARGALRKRWLRWVCESVFRR